MANAIIERMESLGFVINTNKEDIKNVNNKISYVCNPCKQTYERALKDIFRNDRSCRVCNSLRLKSLPTPQDEQNLQDAIAKLPAIEGEEWRPIIGGWISSHSRGINVFGKVLVPDERGRLYFNGALQYPNILIAQAFKDKVSTNTNSLTSDSKTVVSVIDKTKGVSLDNIVVQTWSEALKKGNKNARKSEEFKAAMNTSLMDKILSGVAYKSLAPLCPDHVAFADGMIYNKKQGSGCDRFICGSVQQSGYKLINFNDKHIYVHRLICWAFNRLPDKENYEDYQDLQVNHKNGNKTDNRMENLEWVSQNQNMQHAYDSNLNKKKRAVEQYEIGENNSLGRKIARYESIAKAAKETSEPEHRIRETANGHKKTPQNFWWKFEDESVSEEWRKKFASRTKTNNN